MKGENKMSALNNEETHCEDLEAANHTENNETDFPLETNRGLMEEVKEIKEDRGDRSPDELL